MRAAESIWETTLKSFCESTSGTNPVPASVSIASVTASFALGLLIKILRVTSRRDDFSGDFYKVNELVELAHAEMADLMRAADEDILVFRKYLDALAMPKATLTQSKERELTLLAAARKAIELPIRAAGSAVRSLEVSVVAMDIAHSAVIADIVGAAALLSGSVRAMMASVDSNIRNLNTESDFLARVIPERHRIEGRTVLLADMMLERTLARS